MLVSVSIGARPDGSAKDSLVNLRSTGDFCVNVVTLPQLERMNATAADLPPEASEFEFSSVDLAWHGPSGLPYVADCPAVLECRVFREVDLGAPSSALVLGEVTAVRLAEGLRAPGSWSVDPEKLGPVGRLGGRWYALPGPLRELGRP